MMKEYNSIWCNGSTRDFGSLSLSSSLGMETKITIQSVDKQTGRAVSQGYTLRISRDTQLSNGVLSWVRNGSGKIPDKAYYCNFHMVIVAELVKLLIVVQRIVGSNPTFHTINLHIQTYLCIFVL